MTKRAPGIRSHPRTLDVQRASGAIQDALIKLQEDLDLTDIEMLQCVIWHQETILIRMLRAERHPDDPWAKADEE